MKLILSGGGSGKQTVILDSMFASFVDKSKPLLYIPVAIDTNKHPYVECLKWLRGTFDDLNIKKYEMWTKEDLHKGKKIKPESFGGIYIGGGNTPFLLKTLKETGMIEFLKEAIKKNIPIYGGSAGAVIFAKTIITSLSNDENKVGLKDFNGINIINNRDIWCHYSKEDKTIRDFIKKFDISEVIALSEETGLLITDEIEVIGNKSAYIFKNNSKEEIKTGEKIK